MRRLLEDSWGHHTSPAAAGGVAWARRLCELGNGASRIFWQEWATRTPAAAS